MEISTSIRAGCRDWLAVVSAGSSHAVPLTMGCFVEGKKYFSSGGSQNGRGELVQAMNKRKNTSRQGNKCTLICYQILTVSSGLTDCAPENGSQSGQRVAVTSSPLHSFKITCSPLITIGFCRCKSLPGTGQWNSDTWDRTLLRSLPSPYCLTFVTRCITARKPFLESGTDL